MLMEVNFQKFFFAIRYIDLNSISPNFRGTQEEYGSKPLEQSIVKRVLVFKREI